MPKKNTNSTTLATVHELALKKLKLDNVSLMTNINYLTLLRRLATFPFEDHSKGIPFKRHLTYQDLTVNTPETLSKLYGEQYNTPLMTRKHKPEYKKTITLRYVHAYCRLFMQYGLNHIAASLGISDSALKHILIVYRDTSGVSVTLEELKWNEPETLAQRFASCYDITAQALFKKPNIINASSWETPSTINEKEPNIFVPVPSIHYTTTTPATQKAPLTTLNKSVASETEDLWMDFLNDPALKPLFNDLEESPPSWEAFLNDPLLLPLLNTNTTENTIEPVFTKVGTIPQKTEPQSLISNAGFWKRAATPLLSLELTANDTHKTFKAKNS